MGVGTDDVSKYWGAYVPALEAWQSFMLASMVGFSRAAMMWMMVPLEVGRQVDDDRRAGETAPDFQSLIRHTFDAHKRVETFANGAYASTLDAGRRSFREMEAATLDRGTVDLSLVEVGRAKPL